MDCNAFIERLDDLIEDRLEETVALEARGHAEGCPACRDLMEAARGAMLHRTMEAPPGLLEAILLRTSGPACASARDRLCGFVDGALARQDADLVRMHLDGCTGCAGISGALSRLAIDLPELAWRQPDESLVEGVLSRTSRRAAWRPGRAVALAWDRWMRRPRFAWEGAYIGTVFLMLVFGIPDAPLAGVPRRALELVRAESIEGLAAPARDLPPRVESGARTIWTAARGALLDPARALASDLAAHSASAAESAREKLGTTWDRLTSGNERDESERPDDAAGTEGGEKE